MGKSHRDQLKYVRKQQFKVSRRHPLPLEVRLMDLHMDSILKHIREPSFQEQLTLNAKEWGRNLLIDSRVESSDTLVWAYEPKFPNLDPTKLVKICLCNSDTVLDTQVVDEYSFPDDKYYMSDDNYVCVGFVIGHIDDDKLVFESGPEFGANTFERWQILKVIHNPF